MRNIYIKQLRQLSESIEAMGDLCISAVKNSAKTVLNAGSDDDYKALCDETLQINKEINNMYRTIESLCIRLLLHQQPVATDLRRVSAAQKMIYDMYRIGQQSEEIVELSQYIRNSRADLKLHIENLFGETTKMAENAVKATAQSNLRLAHEVILTDDKVDALFIKVKNELVEIISQKTDAQLCLDLLMVAKYLERIGDHAVSIARWVEFSITGEQL